MYICHIVSTVDVNECIFCVNEQQKVNLERGFHYDTIVQALAKYHSTAGHKCHVTKHFSRFAKIFWI